MNHLLLQTMQSGISRLGLVLLFLFAGFCPVFAQPATDPQPKDAPPTTKPKDAPKKSPLRIVLHGSTGPFTLDVNGKMPATFTDPTTGQSVSPSIGVGTGLTTNGAASLNLRGTGFQDVAQLFVFKGNLFLDMGHSRIRTDFRPQSKQMLPLENTDGYFHSNTYWAYAQYYFKNKTIFTPYVEYKYAAFKSSYKIQNYVSYVAGLDHYSAFPVIDADDGYSSNTGAGGLRIKLPIQNWWIAPYAQYTAHRYYFNLRTGAGNIVTQTNYIPDDSTAILQALNYVNNGTTYNSGNMSQNFTEHSNVGLALFMDYKKFIGVKIDARRNLDAGAWNVRVASFMFFHKNVGVMLTGVYAEPEVTGSLARYWYFGPMLSFEF